MGMADQARKPSTMKTAKAQAQRATAIIVPELKEGRVEAGWEPEVDSDMVVVAGG